jgi:arsenate reductase-like glutaredoxin family protein
MSNENRTDNSTDLVVKVIPPREPSVEYLREMIDDADKKFKEFFSNKDATPRDINNEYFWIKQQLTDLIVVNNMLKKKEKQ